MTYLISAKLALLATAAVISAFTLNLRRCVSAIRWFRILIAEVGYIKKSVVLDISNNLNGRVGNIQYSK
jgi:hypothetical protein